MMTLISLVVTATDLRSGEHVVLRTAPADDAVYASAALAGVLPPLELGPLLPADGAYTDLAPVDVARELESATVIAVDAGRPGPRLRNVRAERESIHALLQLES